MAAAAAAAAVLPPLSASEAARVRQRVYQLFTRLHGLAVPVPATDYLVDVFRVVPANEIDATLTLIIQAYQQQETGALTPPRAPRRPPPPPTPP
jgi:hypothetical protein